MRVLWISALFAVLCGCGGGDGAAGETIVIRAADLAGIWHAAYAENGECGDSTAAQSWILLISVTGNRLDILADNGVRQIAWTATLIDDRFVRMDPTSFPSDGGTTSMRPFDLLFSSPRAFSGTALWDWSDGGASCSGSARVSADRGASGIIRVENQTQMTTISAFRLGYMGTTTDDLLSGPIAPGGSEVLGHFPEGFYDAEAELDSGGAIVWPDTFIERDATHSFVVVFP